MEQPKTKTKKPKITKDDREEMEELENALFGGEATVIEALDNDVIGRPYEDRSGARDQQLGSTHRQPQGHKRARRPVWQDSQDEVIKVNIADISSLRKLRQEEDDDVVDGIDYEQRLRKLHGKFHKNTSWAVKPRQTAATSDEDEDNDFETVLDSVPMVAGRNLTTSKKLPPGRLEATRLRDANQEDPAASIISSVEFHPSGQLLMASGLDKHVRFFNVDGVRNQKVQSLYLEDMPVHKAAFCSGGAQVVATGRRQFFYVLDIEGQKVERVAGLFGKQEKSLESFVTSASSSVAAFLTRDGHIPLVSLKSRQKVGELKMNGTARAGAFSTDGHELITSGGDGRVYIWDLRMNQCRSQYIDEGCIKGTSLAFAPGGKIFASGSSSGVVNVYQRPSSNGASLSMATMAPAFATALPPLRSLPHLTTAVDTLAFNNDGQVLAVASRMKRDALRLVHLPTLTAFSNWPTSRSPLHYIHSLAFSPGSGYLAIGNAKGRVVLYRLHHFPQS